MTVNTGNFGAGQIAATAITTANSGGSAGRAFDSVVGTVTYDTVHTHSGVLSAKVDMAGGTTSQVRWVDGADQASATGYVRAYVWLTGLPSQNLSVIYVTDHGNAFLMRVRVRTDSTVDLLDSTGSVMVTTTATVAIGRWVRIEAKVVCSATVGQGQVRLYNAADSTTPTEDLTSTAAWNTGSTKPGQWRFGGVTNSAAADVFWLDDVASSDTDWLGPARVTNQWTATAAETDAEIVTFPGVGNWLVAVIAARVVDGSAPLLSLGDVSRNLWTLLATDTTEAHAEHTSAQLQVEVWACPTVHYEGWDALRVYAAAMQITAGDVGSVCVNVVEVSGITGALTVDSITVDTADASASLALTAPAPADSANCLMVAAAVCDATTTLTPSGTDWTALASVSRSGPDTRTSAAWREATTGGTATFTLSSGTANLAGVVVAVRTTGAAVSQPNPHWPATQFQVGLGYGLATPLSRVKWTDQTKRFLSLQGGDRGIQGELGTAQLSEGDITIDNRDGAYSPRTAGAATASTSGTTTTVLIPDVSVADINVGDFFRLTDSSGVLKEFTVFQVTATSSAAGTTTVTFGRADGTGTGAKTATASGDLYVGIGIDAYVPYRVLATWQGITYVFCSGWLADLRIVYDGAAYSEVQAVAVDALETLNAATPSALRGEIMRRRPYAYWPCDDATGSGYAANASGVSTSVLTQTTSKFGHGLNGSADFGASTDGTQGPMLGDGATGWAQTGLTSTEIGGSKNQGFALVGKDPGFPPINGGVTILGVTGSTLDDITTMLNAGVDPTVMIIRNTDPGAGGQGAILKLSVDAAGILPKITVWDSATHTPTSFTYGTEQIGGGSLPTVWAVTFDLTSWAVFVDGTQAGSGTFTAGKTFASAFSIIDIGGEADQFFHGRAYLGVHAHIAVFPRRLTVGEFSTIRDLAAGGRLFGEVTSSRIARKLDTVGWLGTRVLNTAPSSVSTEPPPGGSIADTVSEHAGWEDSLAFVDAASQLQYRNRVTAYQQASRATLGENTAAGEIAYEAGMTPSINRTFIYNQVTVENTSAPEAILGTSTFVAVDDASISRYSPKSLTKQTRFAADAAAWDMAYWWLGRYAYPHQRVETITIAAEAASQRWPVVLGVEVGDLLTVMKRPLGAPAYSIQARVIGVQPNLTYGHDGQVTGSVTLTLAAAPPQATILGDPILGVVGDTVLGA